MTKFSLYLLVCDLSLSGTFFPNFIFASDTLSAWEIWSYSIGVQ